MGNHAVQRLINSPYIQAKLQVSTPGDPFEQEADRVADTVMRMTGPTTGDSSRIQTKPQAPRITPLVQRETEEPIEDEKEETVATKSLVQRAVPLAVREDDDDEKVATKLEISRSPQEEEGTSVERRSSTDVPLQRQVGEDDENDGAEVQAAPVIQRQKEEEEEEVHPKLFFNRSPQPEGMSGTLRHNHGAVIHRLCTECEEETEGQKGPMVHRKSAPEQLPDDDVEKRVQAIGVQSSTPKVTTSVAANVHAMNGGGNPLAETTRAFFEPRFGADFSQVRVHTDSRAAETAKSINARAFTVGPNIAFSAGQYAPESREGRQILAHELTHVLQQGNAATGNPGAVHQTRRKIQTFPQAGEILPSTDKQAHYYDHRNDVVDIQGKGTFNPGDGLGNYISSLWEDGQDAAVNIKYGSLGSGYIWVKPRGAYIVEKCRPLDLFGILNICKDTPPESVNYDADLQIMPLKHGAFEKNDKGSLVLVVGMTSGWIYGKLGWVEGKKPDEIEPLGLDSVTRIDEDAFLPLIYGDEYDGQNYTPIKYENQLDNGYLYFLSIGTLELANQQTIEGKLGLVDNFHIWDGKLKGQAIGLEDFEIPIDRSTEAELHGESAELVLDKQWESGSKDSEDGTFTAQGQLRASYKNGTFDFFGNATYSSARINGEVNIAITTESEAQALFAQHAPGEKVTGASGTLPTSIEDGSKEPLALTAWGNLTFKLIDSADTKTADPKAKKSPLTDLEGEGAFVVSPEGYIVLSGKLKFPTNWKFTDAHDYSSADPNNKDKHLFQKDFTFARAPVPFGTINLKVGIEVDAYAHIDPLELYELEISGVYSNHPDYRSEVDITPRFYISGHAGAKVTAKGEAAYRLFGVFTVGAVAGELTGKAEAKAYIDAAPTIKKIWNTPETPASYAIAGEIHSGGKLTFELSGSISVDVLSKKIWDSGNYQIGRWTIGSFGLQLNLNEYVLGSGATPELDYRKIGFGEKERQSLTTAIAKEKEGKEADTRTGGFRQIEGGKVKEKGEFSETEFTRKDSGSEAITNQLEEDFVMQDKLHELVLTFSGTRDAPTALLEMSSPEKRPLEEKILLEETKLAVVKEFLDDDGREQVEEQERDLAAIEKEAKSVKQNAEAAAQKVQGDEEPVVAGFDRLDDRIASYAKKHDTDDLGVILAPAGGAPAIAGPKSLRVPKSNGASAEMEKRLTDKRAEVGYESFESFKQSNVAVFRYFILKPGSYGIGKDAEGPFYEAAVNVANELHSEIIIAGRLEEIRKSQEFKKKYSSGHIIAVNQILSERSPCSMCQDSLGQKSTLIVTSNNHSHWLVHYSGDWIVRNRTLMLKYGLQPPSLKELRARYERRGKPDPH
jgi:hypothetical protein